MLYVSLLCCLLLEPNIWNWTIVIIVKCEWRINRCCFFILTPCLQMDVVPQIQLQHTGMEHWFLCWRMQVQSSLSRHRWRLLKEIFDNYEDVLTDACQCLEDTIADSWSTKQWVGVSSIVTGLQWLVLWKTFYHCQSSTFFQIKGDNLILLKVIRFNDLSAESWANFGAKELEHPSAVNTILWRPFH